ncbi:MAG: hypothetical protein PHQ90_03430 [Sulfuricurvum sp.]|uniref:hypothetical protein n=1 Tax=Sulfuricurvum sp. TaxID=2025608 RepID=UPI00262A1B0B|nr:hypothetical protein [Sulfuricurvum sp.]MDD2368328.1 hypothetical protein [Sulfuricurvum sp.]MDD5117925.1 hypothetical protein [Sulfuricurvum sp.]
MERRKFMRYSVAAAITLPGIVSFSGCGGGGGGGSTTTSLSAVDTQVVSISTLQSASSTLRTNVNTASSALLTSQTGVMLTSVEAYPSYLLFTKYPPLNPAITSWTNYLDYHTLTYSQTTSQITKLKASLRLFGNKQQTSGQAGLTLSSANVTGNAYLDGLLTVIADVLKGDITTAALDSLTLSLKLVKDGLTALLANDAVSGYAYVILTYLAIEKVMKYVEEKSLASLSFTTNTEILLSFTKLAVAALSALAIVSIESLKPTTPVSMALASTTTTLSVADEQKLKAFLQAATLQSQLVITLTSLIDNIMKNVTASTQSRIDALSTALDNQDGSYTLTDEDTALIASLKQQSLVLAGLGLVVKVLTSMYQTGLNANSGTDAGNLQADAETYAILFSDPINSYDTLFSTYISANFTQLFFGDATITQLLTDLASLNPSVPLASSLDLTSVTTNTLNTATSVETDAFSFASLLASLSYQFTSDTATQAATFTTHMADLAYQFTMKIENDAYNFAMTGMEYGYLFASRGEEVGLMADRILWMAVQIGQMADRIGEMADRIVYTEQLIVYTEMLILDFGLLIYGGMKQITNLMLMGMAIVFDRQWYTPTANDQIVTVISEMTKQMLENMKEYENTVLTNQISLREVTLKALNWIQGAY